jgi:uncharacterized membrane protein
MLNFKTLQKYSKPSSVAIFSIVVLIAALFRLYNINLNGLWIDESTLLFVSGAASFSEISHYLLETQNTDRLLPLYFYALYFWKSIFGNDDWILRSLSAFCGILSIFVIARIAWIHFPRWHGVSSVFFASLSAYGIYYSQEGRPYALGILLICILLLVFLNDLRS